MATKATTKSNASARMAARVQAVLAVRAAKHAARVQSRNMALYAAQVAALAAQYGIDPKLASRTLNGTATNIAPKHAPSAVTNACAAVRGLTVQLGFNRQAVLQAAAAAGINPATASTQYAKALKAHKEAASQPTE